MKRSAIFSTFVVSIFSTALCLAEGAPPLRWASLWLDGVAAQPVYMALDGSGNVYVASSIDLGLGLLHDYLTIKYGPDGGWSRLYNGPGDGNDVVTGIAVDSSGSVYVTGQSPGTGTSFDYVTIKYDTSGNQVWAARYNNTLVNGPDYAVEIAVDSDSDSVYVTGYSYGGSDTQFDYATVKYRASDGNQVWVSRYNNPSTNNIDYATAIAVDNSGNAYVTGYSLGNVTGLDYATVKYRASDGNQVWASRYNNSAVNGDDRAKAIAVDNSGSVYVTGYSYGGGSTNFDFATVKYLASDGNQVWVSLYNNPSVNGAEYAKAVAVDNSGNVYVAGYGYYLHDNFLTIKYGPGGGSPLWAQYYGAYSCDLAAMALDSSGNVYVTGYYRNTPMTTYDYATVKYDPNGTRLWTVSYNNSSYGGQQDFATDIAVDNSGDVYVTGYSYWPGAPNSAITTIEYSWHNWCAAAIATDLNGDCKVDFADFAMMAADWLKCNFIIQTDCWQ